MTFPSGNYSKGSWVVFDTHDDPTGILAMIASSHEEAHHKLNICTSYGMLIEIYGKLSKDALKQQLRFQTIFNDLVDNSRESHEIFATWLSITQFSHGKDIDPRILLSNEPSYCHFLKRGDDIVKHIPGLYLKIIIFNSILLFCFQSKKMSLAFVDLENFRPSLIPIRDFPDARLNKVIEEFSPQMLLTILEAFMINNDDKSPAFEYLKLTMQDLPSPQPHEVLGIESVAGSIISHYYKIFQNHFEKINLDSIDLGTEQDLLNEQVINQICALTGEALEEIGIYSSEETNQDRNTLIHYEAEKTTINNSPLDCHIFHYADVPVSINTHFMQLESIIVVARHSVAVKEQFKFDDVGQKWIDQYHDLIVYCPVIIETDQGQEISMIVFDTNEQLYDFLINIRTINSNALVYGCISYSALTIQRFHEDWMYLFERGCNPCIFLSDISQLFLVETGFFPGPEIVDYERAELNIGTKLINVFVTKIKKETGPAVIVIAVAGETFLRLLGRYIKLNFKDIGETTGLYTDNKKIIETVVKYTYLTEHIWYFRTQALPNNFYKNRSTKV